MVVVHIQTQAPKSPTGIGNGHNKQMVIKAIIFIPTDININILNIGLKHTIHLVPYMFCINHTFARKRN